MESMTLPPINEHHTRYSHECNNPHLTYDSLVEDPEHYNFCTVPESGPDAILFAALGTVLACIMAGRLSAIAALLSGIAYQVLVYWFHLGMLSNASAWWLGMQPAEIFFYGFLPPLLLDSAVRIDFFAFRQVLAAVLLFAFVMVSLTVCFMTPILLWGLGLAASKWHYSHALLFVSMLASTDAVAVAALLKASGGPEILSVLMEGESLLNDATSIVLFDIFSALVEEHSNPETEDRSLLEVLPKMLLDLMRLAGGAAIIGLLGGVATSLLLRWLRWRGLGVHVQTAATVGMAYLLFYIANALAHVSGVMAVVVLGLYGASQLRFGMQSRESEESFLAFWDTLAFAVNGMVFFFAGAQASNFIMRSFETLYWEEDKPFRVDVFYLLWRLPVIYVAMHAIRFSCMSFFKPLLNLGERAEPIFTWAGVTFATVAGLRGALSLIMVQAAISEDYGKDTPEIPISRIKTEMATWVSGFVLLTLLVNAPMIPRVLTWTGLNTESRVRLSLREKAKRSILRYTEAAVAELQEDRDEMLRGADWEQVLEECDLSSQLRQFLTKNQESTLHRPGSPMSTPFAKPGSQPDISLVPPAKHVSAVPWTGLSYRQQSSFSAAPGLSAAAVEEGGARGLRSPLLAGHESEGSVDTVPRDVEGGAGGSGDSGRKAKRPDVAVGVKTTAAASRYYSSQMSDVHVVRHDSGLLSAEISGDLVEEAEGVEDHEEVLAEVYAELRLRLVAGFKRFFAEKRKQGLLGLDALRILNFAADRSIEYHREPLAMWKSLQTHIRGSFLTRVQSALVFHVRSLALRLLAATPAFLTPVVRCVVDAALLLVGALQLSVSKQMLTSLELAVEYWNALSFSPQVQWLREHELSGRLIGEVTAEARRAWRHIMAREVESPEKFQALQTHRAIAAVTRQQAAFIKYLEQMGMIDEAEVELLLEPIEHRERHLESGGPRWRQPTIRQVLGMVPFLARQPQHVLEDLSAFMTLHSPPPGEVLLDRVGRDVRTVPRARQLSAAEVPRELSTKSRGSGSKSSEALLGRQSVLRVRASSSAAFLETEEEGQGVFIVVSGLVTTMLDVQGDKEKLFLGIGGVFGLVDQLKCQPLPGMGNVVAGGTQLATGPRLLKLDPGFLQYIRDRASRGESEYAQLELDMFRHSALYYIEHLGEGVVEQLTKQLFPQVCALQWLARTRGEPMSTTRRPHPRPAAGRPDPLADDAIDTELEEGKAAMLSDERVRALALVRRLFGEGSRQTPKALAQDVAGRVVVSMSRSVRSGDLVELPPSQLLLHRSHAVLLRGKLHVVARWRGSTTPSGPGQLTTQAVVKHLTKAISSNLPKGGDELSVALEELPGQVAPAELLTTTESTFEAPCLIPLLDSTKKMLHLAHTSRDKDIVIMPPSLSAASTEHVLLMTGEDGAVILRGVPPHVLSQRQGQAQGGSPMKRQAKESGLGTLAEQAPNAHVEVEGTILEVRQLRSDVSLHAGAQERRVQGMYKVTATQG